VIKLRSLILLMVMLLLVSVAAHAVPVRSGHVNDYAAKLTVNLIGQLEEFLGEYKTNTGIDVNILLVQDMEGMDIDEFDSAVTEDWGLDENHILLLIALDESVIHISKGDGLEEQFPDELLQAALNDMISALSNSSFDVAIQQGVGRLIGLPAETGTDLPSRPSNGEGTGLLDGPFRLVILGGALAVSLVLYFFFLA